jgi:diguanylate cyclase (GGDEF)-like protein
MQSDLVGTTEAAEVMIADAEASSWYDVAFLALYAQIVSLATAGEVDALPSFRTRLMRFAERSGDPAALALALCANSFFLRDRVETKRLANTPADLIKAVVLLESGEGGAFERINAHIECAAVFLVNRLWELQTEQYQQALAVDLSTEHPDARFDPIACGLGAIKHNLASALCHQACTVALSGDITATRVAAAEALPVIADGLDMEVPAEWLRLLRVTRLLPAAMLGEEIEPEADALLAGGDLPNGSVGVVHLSKALSERFSGRGSGGLELETAIRYLADLDRMTEDMLAEYELAISLSVQIEAEHSGVETPGLRFMRHYKSMQLNDRMARLNATLDSLNAERSRAEREVFEDYAHRDDLTRLANRRGYHRYLDQLGDGEFERAAVLVLDADRFKAINDTYGHLSGDEALRRIGAVLAANVRPQDLAARVGGDEFVVVLAGAELDAAVRLGNDLISLLDRPGRAGESGFDQPILMSVGAAAGPADQIEHSHSSADAALYEAKAQGGGRVVKATNVVIS